MRKALIVTFLLLSVFIISSCSSSSKIIAINAKDPGGEVDLKKYVYSGKTTIFDFYADWCGPCRQVGPYLEKLDETREDIVVRKVNIKNWGSPVCKQYNINSVPCFKIYDEKGKLKAEGDEAKQEVIKLLEKIEI